MSAETGDGARTTPRQLDILGVVTDCGPVTASEVGNYHLPIGYSSARSGLQALERQGLISAVYTGHHKPGRAYEVTRRGNEVAKRMQDMALGEDQ